MIKDGSNCLRVVWGLRGQAFLPRLAGYGRRRRKQKPHAVRTFVWPGEDYLGELTLASRFIRRVMPAVAMSLSYSRVHFTDCVVQLAISGLPDVRGGDNASKVTGIGTAPASGAIHGVARPFVTDKFIEGDFVLVAERAA